jgi:hypothetical protein
MTFAVEIAQLGTDTKLESKEFAGHFDMTGVVTLADAEIELARKKWSPRVGANG